MRPLRSIIIWDLGIRLFHWLLVLLIPLLWLLAEQSEALGEWASARGWYFDPMIWHARLGYLVLGLLVFRLLWGFFGSDTAKFSQFLRHPRVVMEYIRKLFTPSTADAPSVGHNPAGGWMVLVLLLLLVIQVTSGLFNFDDVDFEAPFYALVSESISDFMHEWHVLNFDLLLIAIGMHIAAISYYAAVKKDNLVTPMLSGSRTLATDQTPIIVGGWRLWVCTLAGAATVYWLW